MFIFEKAAFTECHASTVVEHEPGNLMAAWFAGDREGAKNVAIWASTFDGKKWSAPAVMGSEPGQPCWNPVLFKTAKGTLYLWYKAGPSPMTWTGFERKSTDAGSPSCRRGRQAASSRRASSIHARFSSTNALTSAARVPRGTTSSSVLGGSSRKVR